MNAIKLHLIFIMLLFLCAVTSNAFPQPNPGYQVDIVKNISYKTDGNLTTYERERCKLDLYIPKDKKMFPVVVWFHGGGLEAGCKEDAIPIGEFFAKHGIAVALVNYRLSPKATYPAYIDDAAASVAWTAKHIEEYGGNPKALFVSGHSAGGYLTAIVGMDPKYLAKYGVNTTQIAGIISVSGQVFTHYTIRKERGIPNSQTTPIIDDAAPCYHARKDAPPTLAICGDNDIPTRAEENRYFIALLKTVGHKDAEYKEIANRDHGSIVGKILEANDPAAEAILAFIDKYKKQ